MPNHYRITLRPGHMKWSPVPAVGSRLEDEASSARPPAPKARLFPSAPTPAYRRRLNLLELLSGLAIDDAFLVTLLWDKSKYAGILPTPEAIGKMRNQFSTEFRQTFPKGHGIWKLELEADRKGVHFHMILNPYVAHPDDAQVLEFTAWANRTWGRIANSKWDRLVEVKRAKPADPGYLTRMDKKASDAALVSHMGKGRTHGRFGCKNAPERPTECFMVTSAQMEELRKDMIQETRGKASYRGGIANHRHIANLERANFGCHFGVSLELHQKIEAISKAQNVQHEEVAQVKQADHSSQDQYAQATAFSGALGTFRRRKAYTGMESLTECRGGPSGAVLWAFASTGRGQGSAPASQQPHMGATHNMTPPWHSAKRLRGP